MKTYIVILKISLTFYQISTTNLVVIRKTNKEPLTSNSRKLGNS